MATYDVIPTCCPHYLPTTNLVAGRTYTCRGCGADIQLPASGSITKVNAIYPGKRDSTHTTYVYSR